MTFNFSKTENKKNGQNEIKIGLWSECETEMEEENLEMLSNCCNDNLFLFFFKLSYLKYFAALLCYCLFVQFN